MTPLGHIEERVLERVVDSIRSRLEIPCRVLAPMENPRYAYDERRSQYDCKAVLDRLKSRCPQQGIGILGITSVDLFLPILKYVFGLSEVGGRSAVISTHRLRPEFYQEQPDIPRLLERVEKTAVHEVAHLVGLTHCRDLGCVMHASTIIQHTDAKGPTLCPTCLELLRWELRQRVPRFRLRDMPKKSADG